MTLSEIDRIARLFAAAGRTSIPVPISEWREMQMAARIGKATTKDGKVRPIDTTPKHLKAAKKAKADRTEKALRANREKKR